MNVELIKETKNKSGDVKLMVILLTNKKDHEKGITFHSINEFYKRMLDDYDPNDITVLGQYMDGGFGTLKTAKHNGDDLKHMDDDYYSSLPPEVKEKMQGRYYSAKITIRT
jgi:fermentation-respiration switch protein FrsA (DUF1100 family)